MQYIEVKFMDRRRFLQSAALTTAAGYLPEVGSFRWQTRRDLLQTIQRGLTPPSAVDIEGHTLICEFKVDSIPWAVYEDFRIRDGALTFVCPTGARVFAKSAEASFAEATTPYLGLSLKDIGTSGADLLAGRLL